MITPDSPLSRYGVSHRWACLPLAHAPPGSTLVPGWLQRSARPARFPHRASACGGEVTIRELPWHGDDFGSTAFERLDSAMPVL